MAAPEDHRGAATGSASERVYRSLLRAYPEDLRREYGEEMARTFRDLRRRELEGRGARGIALLWGRALPELVFTALKERSTMLGRNLAQNAYLPATTAIVTRWGSLSALLGGTTGTAAYCFLGFFPYLPLLVVLLFSVLLSTLGSFGLYGTLAAASGRAGRPGRLAAAGASLAAASAVSWLALGAFAALGMVLGWPAVPTWAAVPTRAATATALCCWFAGLLLLAVAAYRTRLPGRLRVLPLAVVALVPVSVLLPLFTTVGMPLVTILPFLGIALLGWFLLRSAGDGLAMRGRADSGIGAITRRAVGAASSNADGLRSSRTGASVTEAAKEKEVLEALRRRGELAVAGAALETSLTVEEADRMLSSLAAKGHLDVRVERGRLVYSLWEGGAPGV